MQPSLGGPAFATSRSVQGSLGDECGTAMESVCDLACVAISILRGCCTRNPLAFQPRRNPCSHVSCEELGNRLGSLCRPSCFRDYHTLAPTNSASLGWDHWRANCVGCWHYPFGVVSEDSSWWLRRERGYLYHCSVSPGSKLFGRGLCWLFAFPREPIRYCRVAVFRIQTAQDITIPTRGPAYSSQLRRWSVPVSSLDVLS